MQRLASACNDSSHRERVERYGTARGGKTGECLWFGRAGASAAQIVQELVIDDGVADRGHALCIFYPGFKVASAKVGPHKTFGTSALLPAALAHPYRSQPPPPHPPPLPHHPPLPQNIRVNILAPGPISNDFQQAIEDRMSNMMDVDATAMLNQMIPLGRHSEPDEVAKSVLFLASDMSSFSTGSVFMADGGFNA